jgi:hypothetical protein
MRAESSVGTHAKSPSCARHSDTFQSSLSVPQRHGACLGQACSKHVEPHYGDARLRVHSLFPIADGAERAGGQHRNENPP